MDEEGDSSLHRASTASWLRSPCFFCDTLAFGKVGSCFQLSYPLFHWGIFPLSGKHCVTQVDPEVLSLRSQLPKARITGLHHHALPQRTLLPCMGGLRCLPPVTEMIKPTSRFALWSTKATWEVLSRWLVWLMSCSKVSVSFPGSRIWCG